MAATEIKVRMQQRRDTAAGWTSADPVLLTGELGYETDTGYFKLGDGSTAWSSLAYLDFSKISAYPLETADLADDAVTSAKIADGTIVNADVNASAAIADTKLDTISTAGKVSNSATTATDANTASAIVARDASGDFSAGTITADLTGNADTATKLDSTRTFEVTGDVTGTVSSDLTSGASITTSIASGVIVNADVNASAAIAGTKIDPDFGSQNVVTTGTSTAASFIPTSSTVPTNGVYLPSANNVALATNGSQALYINADGDILVADGNRMEIDEVRARDGAGLKLFDDGGAGIFVEDGGNVGVGTTSPTLKLHVDQGTADDTSFTVRNDETGLFVGAYGTGSSFGRQVIINGSRIDGGAFPQLRVAGQGGIVFAVDANSERARIDDSGRLLVGTSSYSGDATIVAQGYAGSPAGPAHFLLKSGTTTPGSSGFSNNLGYLFFSDGNTSGGFGAWILGQRDGGTWTSGSSMPSRLVFSTTADGASSPTERMRISNDGAISCTGTSYLLRGGSGTTSRTLELGSTASGGGNSTSTIKLATYGGNNGVAIIGSGSYNFNSGASLSFQTSPTSGGGTVTRLSIDAGGTITFNAYGAGTLSTNASGVISASDGRYKTKTRQVENALSKILALNPTYFKWDEDCPFATEHEEIGFIAQEVAVVIPEASPGEDQENQYRNYHDRAIIAMLVKAMQEQQAVIDELRIKVAALEAS